MGNGGGVRPAGPNPVSIPADDISTQQAESVSGAKSETVNADTSPQSPQKGADNSESLKQMAKEKGIFHDLVGKLITADLHSTLDKANAPALNENLSKQLKIENEKMADPKAAADLVKRAATDPKLFAQVVNEGTKETKQLMGNAILSDANLTNSQKADMLIKLTEAPKEKGQAAVTMDDILKNATGDGVLGLGKVITDDKLILQSSQLMKGMQGSTISKAIEDLHFSNPSVTPDVKAAMARQMLFQADPKDLESILAKSHNIGTFRDALTIKDSGLFLKMIQNVGPKSMSNLVDIMATSHPSRANWVGQLVPGLNSPDHMNATIDTLQVAGKLDEFLKASYPKAFFDQLTPQNAGAVSAEYSRMAKLEKDPNRAEDYRRNAMQADGMAENKFNKQDYEEYVRIRNNYHAK